MGSQFTIITNVSNFEIQPKDISLENHFFEAFDHTETEVSARHIIRLCQQRGGWFPFTKDEIEAVYNKAGHGGFTFNRLIHPEMVPDSMVTVFAGGYSPRHPVGGGWIIEKEGKFFVTDDFIRRCHKSSVDMAATLSKQS